METWRGWNIYTSADMIRGVTRIQNSRVKNDGVIGEKTLASIRIPTESTTNLITASGTYDTTVNVPHVSEMKPFKCPCCGGNSYKTMNGKTICEYCDTEFMR